MIIKTKIKMNTIVRIKFLFYLIFFLLVGNVQLYAQQKLKFAVESFEQDPFDTSARDKQYELSLIHI